MGIPQSTINAARATTGRAPVQAATGQSGKGYRPPPTPTVAPRTAVAAPRPAPVATRPAVAPSTQLPSYITQKQQQVAQLPRIAAAMNQNPFAQVDASGYSAPSAGAMRGSARFNGGLGARNGNPININEWGAGLWAAGFDPSDPNIAYKLWDWSQHDAGYKEKVGGYWKNNPRTGDARTDLLNSADWYYRDLARRMDKDNKFGSTVLGKVLGTVAPIATSFIPGVGPALSAALSTGVGAATGGLKGALLGLGSSIIAPSIKVPGGIGAAVKAPVQAVTSVAKQFANPATLGRQAVSSKFSALNKPKR